MPDHMVEDPNSIQNPNAMSLMSSTFTHIPYPNQSINNTIKKDEDHLFLHPSCINDNIRRPQDMSTMISNNSNNNHQQTGSVCIILSIIMKFRTILF